MSTNQDLDRSQPETPDARASWPDGLVEGFAQKHRQPFNVLCHLVGMPVIAAGILTLIAARPLRGLIYIGSGLAITFTGHATEGSRPVFTTSRWYASLGAPIWWVRHLWSVARTGRLWDVQSTLR